MEAGYAHPGDGLGAVVAMRMELPGTGYELGFATSSSGEWARNPSSRRRRSAWLWVAKTVASWRGIVSYMRSFCNSSKEG